MFTRQNGRRCILIILMMAFLMAVLPSCLKDDWTYSDLPNGYEVWSFNSSDVALVKHDRKVIDGFVLEFCFNGSYIGLKCIGSEISDSIRKEDIRGGPYPFDPVYYLVDADRDVIMGPYSEEEYGKLLDSLDHCDMSEWIGTRPRPEGSWA